MANDQPEVGLPAGVGSGWAGTQSDSPEDSHFPPRSEPVCTQERDGREEKGRGRRGRKGEEMKERRKRKERRGRRRGLAYLVCWITGSFRMARMAS